MLYLNKSSSILPNDLSFLKHTKHHLENKTQVEQSSGVKNKPGHTPVMPDNHRETKTASTNKTTHKKRRFMIKLGKKQINREH